MNEINKLMDLSKSSSLSSTFSSLNETVDRLIDYINSSWDNDSKIYHRRDSGSHLSVEGKVLREGLQNEFNIIRIAFTKPSRIAISISSNITLPHLPDGKLIIHGRDRNGEYRIEKITPSQIQWDQMTGWAYSQVIYTRLEYIFIQGFDESNVSVITPGSN